MIRYEVSHRTTIEYRQPVSLSQQLLRLTPRTTPQQRVEFSQIDLEPESVGRIDHDDVFGNRCTYLTIRESHRRLSLRARSLVDVSPARTLADVVPWEHAVDLASRPNGRTAAQVSLFAYRSPYVDSPPEAGELTCDVFLPGRPLLEAVRVLTERIHREFRYQGGLTDVWTPVAEVLRHRRGVCQDFAHLQIACLRQLGLPCRYVSGYLLTHPPAGQAKLVGADESHAWVSVWSPQVGWVDFDPTNAVLPGEEHVTIGWGRDYGDVSPVNGFIVGGGEHTVRVAVDVIQIPA
ncbi:MAG: transglutaminase family protein [Burkholderiaceae bacterium]